MYTVAHLLGDKVSEFSSEQEFLEFATKISHENEDNITFDNPMRAVWYLNDYCANLNLLVYPKPLRVADEKVFSRLNYISERSGHYQLGDVVTKPVLDDDQIPTGNIEVGVVIQTFDDSDFRTDMWGMGSLGEGIRHATMEEITALRPDILPHLITL